MPAYKLYYFNLRGRGEIPRLLFAKAGVPYEDERIEFSDWPAFKSKTPFGHLPVLMIDDKPLPESGAIVRYLANEFGLAGANSLESAYADMIFTTVNSAMEKLSGPVNEKDEAVKAEKIKECFEKEIFPVLEKIEKKFSEKCEKNKNSFLVGDSMTYADIGMMHAMFSLKPLSDEIEKRYTKFIELESRISSDPKIKEWLEKRPVTNF